MDVSTQVVDATTAVGSDVGLPATEMTQEKLDQGLEMLAQGNYGSVDPAIWQQIAGLTVDDAKSQSGEGLTLKLLEGAVKQGYNVAKYASALGPAATEAINLLSDSNVTGGEIAAFVGELMLQYLTGKLIGKGAKVDEDLSLALSLLSAKDKDAVYQVMNGKAAGTNILSAAVNTAMRDALPGITWEQVAQDGTMVKWDITYYPELNSALGVAESNAGQDVIVVTYKPGKVLQAVEKVPIIGWIVQAIDSAVNQNDVKQGIADAIASRSKSSVEVGELVAERIQTAVNDAVAASDEKVPVEVGVDVIPLYEYDDDTRKWMDQYHDTTTKMGPAVEIHAPPAIGNVLEEGMLTLPAGENHQQLSSHFASPEEVKLTPGMEKLAPPSSGGTVYGRSENKTAR